jgi:hypothetical protein
MGDAKRDPRFTDTAWGIKHRKALFGEVELDKTIPTRGSSAWFSQHIRRLFELSITN